MKKANLLLLLGAFVAPHFLVAQNNPLLPGTSQSDGAGSSIPSSNPQTGDANGSLPARAAAQATPVKPTHSGKAAERPAGTLRPRMGNADTQTPAVPVVVDRGLDGIDATELIQRVRDLSRENRTEVLHAVDLRLASGEKELNEVRDASTGLLGPARANFNTATSEVKAHERAAKKALAQASSATAAQWEAARSALASAFESYSVALSRAESLSAINH